MEVEQGLADADGHARLRALAAARLLFPPVCAGCRRHVSQPGALCGACWPKLRFLEKPWCAVMGTPFSHDMGEGFLSAEAIANPPPFERARAAVAYSGVARADGARPEVQRPHRSRAVDGALDAAGRVPSWSPTPTWSCRCRCTGGASSAPVQPVGGAGARGRGARRGKPFAPTAVRARQAHAPAGRARPARARGQCARRVRVPPEQDIEVRGRRVLVVDDVYTTGATVAAVAKALKKSGASAVDVLTFARVLPGDFRPDEPRPI